MASGAASTPRLACVDVFLREPRADMERASSIQASSGSSQPSTLPSAYGTRPSRKPPEIPTSVVSIPASVRSPYTPTRPRRDLLRYLSTALTSRGARGCDIVPHFTGDSRDPAPPPPRVAPALLPRPPSHVLPQRQTGDLSRDPDAARPGGPTCRPLCPPAQATSCARRSNVRCPFACHSRSSSPRGSTRGGYEAAPAAAREHKPARQLTNEDWLDDPMSDRLNRPTVTRLERAPWSPASSSPRHWRVLSYPSPQDFGTAANSTNEPSAPGPSSHCSHTLAPREY